jgi:hypothetical protein
VVGSPLVRGSKGLQFASSTNLGGLPQSERHSQRAFVKELYDKGDELALQEISCKTPVPKNRVPEEIEDAGSGMGSKAGFRTLTWSQYGCPMEKSIRSLQGRRIMNEFYNLGDR